MMQILLFILNLPYSLLSLIPVIISNPYKVQLIKNPLALVFKVKSFWWAFSYFKNARAMTIGHIILLGPNELKNDLEHEIIHVNQHERYPVIFPILYLYEFIRRGNRFNRFEDEAYKLSKSIYKVK